MEKIAPSYSEQQVLLCSIDVVLNPDMLKYLDGRAPITRLFSKGKVTKSFFQGKQNEEFIRKYIDSVVADANK